MSTLPTSIRRYVGRIKANWYKATESIMKVAQLCAEANDQLSAADKNKLLENLPFSGGTFSKLAQIGADQRLQSPRVKKLLPPSYSIIYDVKLLEDEDFKTAFKEGIVHPDLKRADLRNWLEKRSAQDEASKPRPFSLPIEFFAAIKLSERLPSDQLERLDGMLEQIQSDFKAEIVRPRDPMERYLNAMGRYHKRVENRMRIGARRMVREVKQQRLKANRKWGLIWEETDIDWDADQDRIQEVLDNIGRSDALSKLREVAEKEAKEPSPPENPYCSEVVVTDRQREEFERQLSERRERRKATKYSREDFRGWT